MKTRRGITLIEMLIAMSVLSVVLLAVLNVLNFSKSAWNNQVGRSEAISEANLAVEMMSKEIGNAVSYQTDSNNAPSIFILPANTDANGNYVPALQSGSLGYAAGTPVQFYLSDKNGTASTGTTLWRQTSSTTTTTSGGLLGTGLLGGTTTTTTWTPDAAWSQLPGGKAGKFPDVTALAFRTAGLPANTVQVSVTVTIKEGGQSSRYTVTRNVYLANHN